MKVGLVLQQLNYLKQNNKHAFAVLIDPDKIVPNKMEQFAKLCNDAKVDFLFVGGSLVLQHQISLCIEIFKKNSTIPILLFPGNPAQVTPEADALLYLSLISGRNADLLIGQHVVSAPMVRNSGLEILSTGYMVIDGGVPTTVSYMSHSHPIPSDKSDIALCTAWAGEMQGKHLIYMDAGSGAQQPVSEEMIRKVSSNISIPLIVGGGIKTPERVMINCKAGADLIVVGNAIEKDSSLVKELCMATKL
jgi:putative glycerol-1-phosphate prenyltransferase